MRILATDFTPAYWVLVLMWAGVAVVATTVMAALVFAIASIRRSRRGRRTRRGFELLPPQ